MPALVTRFHILLLTVTVAITGVGFYRIAPGFVFHAHRGQHAGDWLWPRDAALLVAPLLAALLLAAFAILSRATSPSYLPKIRHVLDPALTVPLVVIAAVQLGLLLTGIGSDLNLVRLTAFGLGAVLIGIGIILAEAERHTYAGLRLPWPIASDRAWRIVHRLTGASFGLAGLALLALAWFQPDLGPMLIGLTLALTIPPAIGGLATPLLDRA